ncbi:ricin-type beta-trefoil lectin domain protein [Kitasatospora sp. McL0602]|uniref:ricin-type beta-trefoil lectin domain protein n=1 Tax=Kitasatospora sp. McL0602 TaxID=3439530 RepID=UPI003F8C6B44
MISPWAFAGWFNRNGGYVDFSNPAGGPIINNGLGVCVDSSNGSTANGNPIQTWGCTGTASQWWTRNGNSYSALNKCLDVWQGSKAQGATVDLYDCNGTGSQEWQFRNGALYNPQSGLCLDVPNGSRNQGVRLQLWGCNGSAAQQWSVAQG